MNSLDSVKKLNLPKGKFAIFGSSILSIRNIREADDIDILVKEDVRDSLARTYPVRQMISGHGNRKDGDNERSDTSLWHGKRKR